MSNTTPVIQNKICFNHPLQLSIALTYLAGENDDGNPTYVDFNNIYPIFKFASLQHLNDTSRKLICWGTPNNAHDVKINTDNHTISFKTDLNYPTGIIDMLHQKLPGGWVWKFASKSPGFILGYYETKGRERFYYDLSKDYETNDSNAIALYNELWADQITKRKEDAK